MSNPLHDLYIRAEQPDEQNSMMSFLGSLSSRYEFISLLHEEKDRTFAKYKDLASGRDVVIVQLISNKEADLKIFSREVKLSAKLQHPVTVPLYDAGQNDKGLYFARKWIDELSLKERLQASKKIWSKEQAMRIFIQLCEALSYAHSLNISHGNLKAEKVFVSDSGNVLLTDWSKASCEEENECIKDVAALGQILLDILSLCKDFESIPDSLKAIAKKAGGPGNSYKSVQEIMTDCQAYRDGYVPKAVNFYLLRSAFQVFKRNPLFSIFLIGSAVFIISLTLWFFSNLKERQLLIDKNLIEAESKKQDANKALKEFQKENQLRNEISMEAAEAHAAEARAALKMGDLEKAIEMGSIAWQLNKNEKFTQETRAHLSFIEQDYSSAMEYYKNSKKYYFDNILKLSQKYHNKPPGIDELLSDYEKSDRKELMSFSINRLLMQKNGEEFKKAFYKIVRHFNPKAQISTDIKFLESSMELSFAGSRDLHNLEFLHGMPIESLDIRNTGISNLNLEAVPQLKTVYLNQGQTVKTLRQVKKVSQ